MKLHYQISGEGSPLIILHGLFGTLENWGSQAITLSKTYQVISVDLRNHGRSPHSDTMNYSLMASDVIELMNDLDICSAAIIGHSMGGKVAMQIALNYSDRVENLIVVDISPVKYEAHHDDIFKGLLSLDLEALTSRKTANDHLSSYVNNPSVRAFLLKNLHKNQDQKFAWRPNINALRKEYSKLSLAPFAETETAFSKPSLFIKGKNSDYIIAEHQNAIASLFSKASFKMIEGAGHWPHAEKPKIFSSIVQKFLDS